MKPRVWVFSICFNEMPMINWYLRHYSTFAEKIIIWDEHSTDGTREAIRACPKAELRDWPHKGLNDVEFIKTVNWHYREARWKADWVMWPDIDELLYHPDILRVLAEAKEDMIASTGYALISPDGLPKDDGQQLYEQVRYGIPQANYDKFLVWRPGVTIEHNIGRHTFPPTWPKCSGRIGTEPKLKLLHCHHVGGVEHTRFINARNTERAVEKKYAWNYGALHDKPEQVGTVSWVRDAIKNKRLVNVMAIQDWEPLKESYRKIQFGCGLNRLAGWENYDQEVRIDKPLNFQDGCASHLFAEHVVEHTTHKQAWLFLAECWRILKHGGVVRIAIPDIARMAKRMTPEYASAVKAGGHGDGSPQSAIKAAVFEHGHQAAWTAQLLVTFMEAIGFKAEICAMGQSRHPELNGIDGHGKVVGENIALVETSIVEGTK